MPRIKKTRTRVFKGVGKPAFTAVWAAEKYLKRLGYSYGSMCYDEPIGIAKGLGRYIAKWYNLSPADKARLDGVMESDDFRDGDVKVTLFAPGERYTG